MVTIRKAEDTTGAAPDSAEGHALDGLIQQAEATHEAPAPGGVAVKTDTLEADLQDVLRMAAEFAEPMAWFLTPERFAQLWGPARLKAIAGPGAEIMRRNGWTIVGLMGKWAPYMALGAAIGPPAVATLQAYRMATAGGVSAPAAAPAPAAGSDHG